jgi:hypothetical protein
MSGILAAILVLTGAAVGDPCNTDAQCPGGVCIPELSGEGVPTGWPGGYCTVLCDGAPCPGGSQCIGFDNAQYCLKSCADISGCRTCGYACDDTNGPGFCTANCTNAGYGCSANDVCDGAIGLCTPSCSQVGCEVGSLCNHQTGFCSSGGCAGVSCPTSQYCDPQIGRCRVKGCEQTGCPAGQFCDANCHTCLPLSQGCEYTGCPPGISCSTTTHSCGPTQGCEITGCGCGHVCNHTTHVCEPAACEVDAQCPRPSSCDEITLKCVCSGTSCAIDADCAQGERCALGTLVCEPIVPPGPRGKKSGCASGDAAGAALVLLMMALLVRSRRPAPVSARAPAGRPPGCRR